MPFTGITLTLSMPQPSLCVERVLHQVRLWEWSSVHLSRVYLEYCSLVSLSLVLVSIGPWASPFILNLVYSMSHVIALCHSGVLSFCLPLAFSLCQRREHSWSFAAWHLRYGHIFVR